jgi:hypothetical protein
MRNVPILIALLIIATSCTTNSKSALSEETSRLSPEPDLKERLLYEKTLTDTVFSRSNDKVEVLVKLVGREKLVKVDNKHQPEDIAVTFHLLFDTPGRITRISESPYSESGDWRIMYSHYFDSNGNTFAHERSVTAFNTFCPDEPANLDRLSTETIVRLFNPAHQLIDSTYQLADEENKDLTGRKCQQQVQSDLTVFDNIEEYKKNKGINIGR